MFLALMAPTVALRLPQSVNPAAEAFGATASAAAQVSRARIRGMARMLSRLVERCSDGGPCAVTQRRDIIARIQRRQDLDMGIHVLAQHEAVLGQRLPRPVH